MPQGIGGQLAEGYHLWGDSPSSLNVLRPSSHGVREPWGEAGPGGAPSWNQPEVTTVSMTRSRSKTTEKPL